MAFTTEHLCFQTTCLVQRILARTTASVKNGSTQFSATVLP